jgi:hypothetical protein
MKAAAITLRVLISLTGLTLLVLGILFWTGRTLSLVPLHMLLGVVLALLLWILAGLALHAGLARGLTVLVVLWSLIMLIFGVWQVQLLPGGWHWVIEVLHLLVGFAAIGLGHALARHIAVAESQAGAEPPI